MICSVASAILAALAGLIGLVAGRLWDTRSESTRWRRDQRVMSYQSVACEFYRYREVLRLTSACPKDSPDRVHATATLMEHHAVWNQCLSALWLHGSENAARAAYELDHAISILGDYVYEHEIPPDEWVLRKEEAQEKFDDYIDAVRKDLSLPALGVLRERAHDRIAWRRP
jgi:hypothetical protein